MTRQQRKTIEREFYLYAENRDAAASRVAEFALDGFGKDYSDPRVKSSPRGNPQEETVTEVIAETERMWKWCRVFEKTLERFKWTQKDELMRRRYIQKETDTATCMALFISRSTYYLWLEEILLAAFAWALELQIF